MVNRKKIATWDKVTAHNLSVNTDEDYVSEMRFKKCLMDAAATIARKYVKDVRSNIDHSKEVDDKCIEDAKAKVSDSALQESDRWTSLQLKWCWA